MSKKPSETHLQSTEMEEPSKEAQPVAQEQEKPSRNDIATQWEMEEPSTELEHNIPILTLMDDKDTPTELNNNMPQKSDNSKRLDLFALSEGMPLSLRGSVVNEERVSVKESVNIVSEFLRNRAMRLRETDHISSLNKSQCGDLVGVKETILRTRSSRTEGTSYVCHVLDEQVIPVPSWESQKCQLCYHQVLMHKTNINNKILNEVTKRKSYQEPCSNLSLSKKSLIKKSTVYHGNSEHLSNLL